MGCLNLPRAITTDDYTHPIEQIFTVNTDQDLTNFATVSMRLPGSVQEVERWNSEVELSTLDQSVVHMERSALQIREQTSVVPPFG